MPTPSANQPKLRVCFFIPGFDYGGAQKQCILLINELQRRDDVELTLIRFRPGAQDHLLETHNLRCEYVKVRSNFDIRAVITVARLVSAYKIDVIISWVRVCDVYSYFIRRLTPKVRWVMTQRNSRHADTWLFRLRDFLGQRADAIAANSPGGVQWWRERRTGGSVHLVSNIAAPRHEPGTEQRKQSVLYVGRLEPQKNVETMIKAFALVAQSHPTVSIWVCGDGSLRAQLEQIAVRAGLEDRIEFLGFRQDATEWMARARVVVSLSDHEGMPNVLMEAVQAKCTIVASGIKEHIDFLGPSYPLLVENHHDAEEAAAKIAEGLRTNCSSDHLTHALKRLESMEASEVADSYMQIFQSVALPKTEGCSTSER